MSLRGKQERLQQGWYLSLIFHLFKSTKKCPCNLKINQFEMTGHLNLIYVMFFNKLFKQQYSTKYKEKIL